MRLEPCLLLLMLSCAPAEPELIRVPEHFRLLGDDLRIEAGEVSGPLGLYEVSWRGERLLPLGYSFWSGEVNAANGPGVRLLVALYPDGSIPRDLNCKRIIHTFAEMEQRWLIEARWLEDAILSDSLNTLRSYLPHPRSIVFDFGSDSWISVDPLDERLYSGSFHLRFYPGERRMYIGLNTEQLRTLHLTKENRLIVLDRPAGSAGSWR